MKSVLQKANLKFNVGQKVYYKAGKKVKGTTIKEIKIETVVKKSKKNSQMCEKTSIVYTALANMSKYGHHGYRWNHHFKENQLYTSQEAASNGMIPTEKTKIEKLIKKVKKNIATNKQSIQKANKKLEEIKKEELIETLAGI